MPKENLADQNRQELLLTQVVPQFSSWALHATAWVLYNWVQ